MAKTKPKPKIERICMDCPEASGFYDEPKGKNADQTKILFVLHRPDRRVVPALPGFNGHETALLKTATGRVLGSVLRGAGLTFNDVYITNLYKCMLPNDREPVDYEYHRCIRVFEKQIADFQPRCMVLFGGKALELLCNSQINHHEGELFSYCPPSYERVLALAMHHPSAPWLKGKYLEGYVRKIRDYLIED